MAEPSPQLKDLLLNDLSSSMATANDDIGNSAQAPSSPIVPDHSLLRCVGKGSYGEVWLARNALGAFRAVKIVRRQAFDSERPYEREFAGIRRFEPISRSHPSQLNVLHVGRDDAAGLFYYVMELADDVELTSKPATALQPETYVPRTLRSEMQRRGRLPCAECLDIATALATALDHLHRHGLVHRDIKPSNIIFVNGIPKLADIGLVTGLEATLSFVGTEGYVPPEGPGTPQGDIYSLGKVLYEMSSGRDRHDYPELPTNLIEAPAAERSALAELNEVIVRACHADREERYQSAAELHADLALLQSGKSVTRMRAVERSLRVVRRAGALVTAVALVIGAGWFWQARQTTRIRELATEKARLAEENSQRIVRLDVANGNRLLDEGDASGALLWFADALPRLTNDPAREAIHRIRIQQALDKTPRLLRVFPHESGIWSAAWSRDGRFVATGTRGGNLRMWTVEDGSIVWGADTMGTGVGFLRFSRDGKRLFASSNVEQWAFNGGVDSRNFYAVFDAESGDKLFSSSQLGHIGSTNVVCSHFSPDDRWLAIAGKDNRIRVLDLSDGSWIAELAGHRNEVRFLSFSGDGSLLASASLDRTVRFWRLPEGGPVGPVLEHRFPVVRVLLASDGQHLITACFENPGGFGNAKSQAGEGEIQAWEASTGQRLGEPLKSRDWLLMYLNPAQPDRYYDHDNAFSFAAPGQPLYRIQAGFVQSWDFSSDSRRLALGESRNAARIFDAASGELVAGPFSHGGEVSAVGLSPSGRQLLTAGGDGSARLWDVQLASAESVSRRLPAPLGDTDPVGFAATVRGLPGLTAFEHEEGIGIFNDELQEIERFAPSGPVQGFSGLQPSRRGDFWVSYQREPDRKAVVLWHSRSGDPHPVLLQHPDEVIAAMFARDDQFVVTSCRDGIVRFWNVSDGALAREVAVREGGEGWVPQISPGGDLAIWVPHNLPEQQLLRILDLESGKLGPLIEVQEGGILDTRFAPDGKHFAVWDFMGAVRIFRSTSGDPSSCTIQHSGNLRWTEWDPDSRRLLTAGGEEVLVWNALTGVQLYGPLRMPGGSIRVAHWSPDGRFIIACNDAKAVRVWEAATGEAVTPLLQHSGDVLAALMTQKHRLLTVSYPDVLRAWDLRETRLSADVLADYAKLLSGRQLSESGALLTVRPDQLASLHRSLQVRAPALFR